MGLLSRILATGAKGADVSKAARSIPKREMNPLIKRRGEELRKKIEEENVGLGEDTTVGKMYSPVISTAEQMDIGAAGTKAENIEAFIRKRAPNVTESEKQYYGLNFLSDEPKRRFTREEVLEELKGVNTEYTIHKRSTYGDGDTTQQFGSMQRQPIAARKVKYEELMVNADKRSIPLGEEVNHFNPETVVHTRLSVIRPHDDNNYKAVLIEEIQSDLHRIAKMTDDEVRDTFEQQRKTPFFGMYRMDEDGQNITAYEWHDYLVNSTAYEYSLKIGNDQAFFSIIDAYHRLEKLESVTRIQGALENGRRQIKEQLRLKLKDEGIIVDARDPYDLIKKAYKYVMELEPDVLDIESNFADYASFGGADDGMANMFQEQIDQFVPDIMEQYDDMIRTNIKFNRGELEYKADPRRPAPVQSNTEVMRKGILANIAYAKENGINKILIPSAKEIAQQRVKTFASIRHQVKDQKLLDRYDEFMNKGYEGAADDVALEYFTKVFEPMYGNAVQKVLRSLTQETKGAIKIGKKEMPYKNVLENTTEMKTLIEIDITDFKFDPKNDALRFNRGGLVA